MSRFSGKCDFCDFIEIHGFDYMKRSKVYLGFSFGEDFEIIPGKQIHIETIEDCIPYYPHIVSMSIGDKDSATIFLTERSWVDIEEEKYGKKLCCHDYYRKLLQEEIEKHQKVGGM